MSSIESPLLRMTQTTPTCLWNDSADPVELAQAIGWGAVGATCNPVIALSALAREDSRGAHFREDFPQAGAFEDSHYIVVRQDGDALRMTREAVCFTRVSPGQSLLVDA